METQTKKKGSRNEAPLARITALVISVSSIEIISKRIRRINVTLHVSRRHSRGARQQQRGQRIIGENRAPRSRRLTSERVHEKKMPKIAVKVVILSEKTETLRHRQTRQCIVRPKAGSEVTQIAREAVVR